MVIHGDCLLDFLAPFAHISVDMVEFVEHAGLCRSAAPQCLLFSEFKYLWHFPTQINAVIFTFSPEQCDNSKAWCLNLGAIRVAAGHHGPSRSF